MRHPTCLAYTRWTQWTRLIRLVGYTEGSDSANPQSEEEVKEMLSVLDVNNDGKISTREVVALLERMNDTLDINKVEQYINERDQDKDGYLDLNELAALLADE
ncbi:hypothetical protein PHET_02160 [Paragonimus heterotremus]|uniref:EF-hand domain-containing protein n=1 Tax=Paragonimus heterotremus TaxID=100268 RepID=A0A8J4TGJ2_9TREM|nr:hypothetical protein PHET_02160 [Paragonimus heterotremus]